MDTEKVNTLSVVLMDRILAGSYSGTCWRGKFRMLWRRETGQDGGGSEAGRKQPTNKYRHKRQLQQLFGRGRGRGRGDGDAD